MWPPCGPQPPAVRAAQGPPLRNALPSILMTHMTSLGPYIGLRKKSNAFPDQKSGLPAVGTAEFVAGYHWMLSAQASSSRSSKARRSVTVADQGIVKAPTPSTVTWICSPMPLWLGSAAGPLSGFANWKFSFASRLLLPSWTRNLKALPGVGQRLARSVFQQLARTPLMA